MHEVLAALLLVTAIQNAALTFTAPPEWNTRPLASSMRVAEFVPPRAPGDSEDADVIVYFFGGTGGSVQANIDRWIGQFKSDPATAAAPTPATTSVNGLKLTTVAVEGTYVAEVRPGSTERHNKPNFRMRAVVVETPKGPYFIKLTGPAATVRQASASFDQFLRTLKFQ
ncbi:MAG: hypothetical protein ABIS06_01830 [Vicinamibacterales bacterium]